MTTASQSVAAVIGRLSLAIFLVSAVITTITDYHGRTDASTDQGFLMSLSLVVLAVAIQAAGALSLLLGFATRPVALGLAIWMALAMFIRLAIEGQLDELTFAALCRETGRALAVIGGLLLLAAHGAGAWSIDERRRPRMSLGDSNVLG